MESSRYAELIDADARRLAAVAHGRLDAAVPSCPGWTVDDLVEHLAMVYDHKIACMREQRHPEWWPPDPPAGDRLDWLARSREQLLGELTARGPEAPAFTWYPPDQTVGFWFRRMAQETAVHRVDAELAAGDPTPIAPDLAVDGVDEALSVVLASAPSTGPPHLVRVACGDRAWFVELAADTVTVTSAPPASGAVEATVTAEPSALLLWLWGRSPREVVTAEGDESAVTALRDRLVEATQ